MEESQYTSNVETDVERDTLTRPQRKKRQRCYSSSSSDDEEVTPKRAPQTKLPPPPTIGLPRPSPSASKGLPMMVSSPPVVSPRQRTPVPEASSSSTRPDSVFERHILKLLQGLQTNFAELQKGQREIKEMLQAQAGTSAAEADPSLDVTFPIQDAKALGELELRLADPQMADRLVSNLSTIGGSSVKDVTRRLMKHTMSDHCATGFNWKGKGEKRAFCGMKLQRVVIRAVRRNARTAAATDAEVENEIKYWLKFAAERDGSRQRRTQVQVTPGTSVQ